MASQLSLSDTQWQPTFAKATAGNLRLNRERRLACLAEARLRMRASEGWR